MAILGYNTIPATPNSLPGNFCFGNGPYTMSEDGTPVSMSVYVTTGLSNPCRMCIYTDAAGTPGSFVDVSEPVNVLSTGWQTANVEHGTLLTNATGYWLMVWTSNVSGGINIPTDGGGDSDFDGSFTYAATGDPPAYASGGSGTNVIGIYVTYTPVGAGEEASVQQSDRLRKVQRAIY